MEHSNTPYKGYNIQKRIDVKTRTCIIYNNKGEIVKCIAGSIFQDGTENAIEKAKQFIDNIK